MQLLKLAQDFLADVIDGQQSAEVLYLAQKNKEIVEKA